MLAGTVDQYVPESVCYFREVIQPQLDGRQITYLGPVNMQQKIDLFSRARALLNPLQWEEPFGMVMIEAMAVGCPVIAFPYGAAPEIVAHGRSGFLARHVDEMVQSIKQIDRLDRSTVRAYAEAHFSARVMAEQYVALYRKVIASAMDGSRHGMPVASSARGGELDLAIA